MAGTGGCDTVYKAVAGVRACVCWAAERLLCNLTCFWMGYKWVTVSHTLSLKVVFDPTTVTRSHQTCADPTRGRCTFSQPGWAQTCSTQAPASNSVPTPTLTCWQPALCTKASTLTKLLPQSPRAERHSKPTEQQQLSNTLTQNPLAQAAAATTAAAGGSHPAGVVGPCLPAACAAVGGSPPAGACHLGQWVASYQGVAPRSLLVGLHSRLPEGRRSHSRPA